MPIVLLFLLISRAYSLDASCCYDADSQIETANGDIEGNPIPIRNAPYMASVRLYGTLHWCSASIIHEKFVLTAAHCIEPNRTYKVLVGTDNINGGGQLYDIENTIIHENYTGKSYDFDFCLIELNKSLEFGLKVNSVNLTVSDSKLHQGTCLNVTGWCSNESKEVPPILRQVAIPKTGKKRCASYYNGKYKITPRMFCAGPRVGLSCKSDSGGPITWYDETSGVDVLVGVTSFQLSGDPALGVYARVVSVAHWIKRSLNIEQAKVKKLFNEH